MRSATAVRFCCKRDPRRGHRRDDRRRRRRAGPGPAAAPVVPKPACSLQSFFTYRDRQALACRQRKPVETVDRLAAKVVSGIP